MLSCSDSLNEGGLCRTGPAILTNEFKQLSQGGNKIMYDIIFEAVRISHTPPDNSRGGSPEEGYLRGGVLIILDVDIL